MGTTTSMELLKKLGMTIQRVAQEEKKPIPKGIKRIEMGALRRGIDLGLYQNPDRLYQNTTYTDVRNQIGTYLTLLAPLTKTSEGQRIIAQGECLEICTMQPDKKDSIDLLVIGDGKNKSYFHRVPNMGGRGFGYLEIGQNTYNRLKATTKPKTLLSDTLMTPATKEIIANQQEAYQGLF